ncbi:MAG: MarR family winged helix-turn-helix transcriptional regulator [Dermatophilaceae bacterium]|nr:MarR family transcriptional regulator [Intrasporangiaceae bacterium]
MTESQQRKHQLTGLPDAVIHVLRALEEDRRRIASDHGLSSSELRSLFRIAESGSLTPRQLANDLSLTNGAITGISTRLVDAGLLHRVPHPDDRRSLCLELTEEAHRAMARIHADFAAMMGAATVDLTDEELDIATRALRQVTDAIRARQTPSSTTDARP